MRTKPVPVSFRLKTDALDRIIAEDSVYERIASGFRWAEGPVWLPDQQVLRFSDVVGNTIYQWDETNGTGVFRQPSGMANGNTIDSQGRLLTCEHATRRVTRTEKDGTVVSIASHYSGKQLNSPNDIVVRSDGTIYFTDPPFGLNDTWGVPGTQQLDFQGVFRITREGELHLEAKDIKTPNGLALSPNEQKLYVADTEKQQILVFSVSPDGSLRDERIFTRLDESLGYGWPDGLKTDVLGNVYTTGPGGIWIIADDGTALGVINTPEPATNMNWGGPYHQDLYITTATLNFTRSAVYRLKLSVRGFSSHLAGL
jgi:sugar lactone lactonase YvrE